MLPEIDGFEVCRILRKEMITPILMLTARDDEIDRVVGLEVGADDYLTKPFSMRELMARVKAQIRRSRLLREEIDKSNETQKQHEKLKFDNLIVNLTRREVTLDESRLRLNHRNMNCSSSLRNTKDKCSHADLSLSASGAGTSLATAAQWMCM